MWTWLLIALGALIGAGALLYFFYFDRRTHLQRMAEEDGTDPLKRWARGVYALLSPQDYGRLPQGGAQMILRRDWGCETPAKLHGLLERRFALETGDPAWDLVRAVILARLGAAAGYMSPPDSWAVVGRARNEILRHYACWAELGEAYADARMRWLRSTGEVEPDEKRPFDEVRYAMKDLAQNLWPHVAFSVTR